MGNGDGAMSETHVHKCLCAGAKCVERLADDVRTHGVHRLPRGDGYACARGSEFEPSKVAEADLRFVHDDGYPAQVALDELAGDERSLFLEGPHLVLEAETAA